MQIHATCCALAGPAETPGAPPPGVLLLGSPGSGKSDLALRLIDTGFSLVADDRVDLAVGERPLIASGPAALAGLLEVRGIGIVRLGTVSRARVALAVALGRREAAGRLPEPMTTDFAGHAVPTIAIDPEAASAVARVRLALAILEGRAASRCGALGDTGGAGAAR